MKFIKKIFKNVRLLIRNNCEFSKQDIKAKRSNQTEVFEQEEEGVVFIR